MDRVCRFFVFMNDQLTYLFDLMFTLVSNIKPQRIV